MAEVWMNGVMVPAADAVVGIDDRGFTVGDGVFEAIKLDASGPFAVTRHLRRLRRSAERLGVTLVDDDVLRDAIDAVAATADRDTTSVIRLTLSAGRGGGTRRSDGEPTLVVAIRAAAAPTAVVDVAVSPWPRNERAALAGVKTTSYAENVVALEHAARDGAGEVLFANTVGELCEGAGSNVFVEVGARLVTPPLSSGCLPGVTRELLLELGVGDEAAIPIDALATTSEAFLTSTTREVQPIRRVDARALPAAPGPLTAAAATAWADAYGPGGPLDP